MRIAALIILLFSFTLRAELNNWTNQQTTSYGVSSTNLLWGTWANQLMITNSGTASAPTVFRFMPGAKFSASTWPDAEAIIGGTNLSWVIIDGQTNGVIEATDNGSASIGKTYQRQPRGVWLHSSSNCVVMDLQITNLYRLFATDLPTDNAAGATGVHITGNTTNFLMLRCAVSWCNRAIWTACDVDVSTVVASNRADFCAEYFFSGNFVTNTTVKANAVDRNWPWTNAPPHPDGFQWIASEGCFNRGLRVFGNYCGPTMGWASAAIFLETGSYTETNIADAWIFNNVIHTGNYPDNFIGDGVFYFKNGVHDVLVANNTIYAADGFGQVLHCATGTERGIRFLNNLVVGKRVLISYQNHGGSGIEALAQSDYNLLGINIAYPFEPLYVGKTWAQWQALGWDAHSSTNTPALMLNADLSPATNDTVAVGTGTNLSAYFTTDINGNPRTNSGPWTIGAFEIASMNAPTSPPPEEPPSFGGTTLRAGTVRFR